MKYHGLKMEEVNDTMKHLWNKTYQGTGTYFFYFQPAQLQLYQISTESRSALTLREGLLNDRIIIGSVTCGLFFS